MTTRTRNTKLLDRPRKRRERLLFEGMKGSGKTYAWLKIARRLKKKGVVFRAIDTDDALTALLEDEFPDLIPEEGGNVYAYPVYDWREYVEAKNILMKESQTDDWNVVDMAHMAWKTVERYFIEQVFKQGMDQFFLETRKKMAAQSDNSKKGKSGSPLDGWRDWGVINRLYDEFMLPLVYKSPAHLVIVTSIDTVSREDDQSTRDLYGPFGVKPRGQKDLGHQCQGEFLFKQGRDQGTWEISTIKDRARMHRYPDQEYFYDTPLKDFAFQYLQKVAGWELL